MRAEYEDYEDLEDEDLFEEDDSEDPYDLEVQAVNAELEASGVSRTGAPRT